MSHIGSMKVLRYLGTGYLHVFAIMFVRWVETIGVMKYQLEFDSEYCSA